MKKRTSQLILCSSPSHSICRLELLLFPSSRSSAPDTQSKKQQFTAMSAPNNNNSNSRPKNSTSNSVVSTSMPTDESKNWISELDSNGWHVDGIELGDVAMMKALFNNLGIPGDFERQSQLRAHIKNHQANGKKSFIWFISSLMNFFKSSFANNSSATLCIDKIMHCGYIFYFYRPQRFNCQL